MAKEICISSTPHETRLAILEDDQLAEIYYERENEYTLAGSIYNGRVTRVLPGMQSAFVDIGLERDAFLYVTDFLELDDQEDADELEKAAVAGGNQPPREVRSEGRAKEQERPARPAQAPPQAQQRPEPRPERRPAPQPVETILVESFETADAVGAEPATDFDQSQDDANSPKRWRGRRRRRSGRGSAAQPQDANQDLTAQPQADAPEFEIEEIEVAPVAEAVAVESFVQEPVFETAPAPRRDRDRDRGRDRDRNDRGERGERERDRAPRRDAEPSSAATPFVLPGESLSKYGGTPAETDAATEASAPAAPARTLTQFKPATLIEVPLEWDGSGLLPGESISRHRQPAAEAAAEPIAATPTFVVEPVEETSLPVSEQPQVVEELLVDEPLEPVAPAVEVAAVVEAAEPQQIVEEFVEEELVEEEVHVPAQPKAEIAEELVEEELAHEPEADASASHHVDPAAPQGFRILDLFKKGAAKEESAPAAPAEVELVEEEAFAAPARPRNPRRDRNADRNSNRNADRNSDRNVDRNANRNNVANLNDLDEESFEQRLTGRDDEDEIEGEDEEGASTADGAQRRDRNRRDRNDRSSRGRNDQRPGKNGRAPSRRSMQTTDLPAITDLLKPGQEILVQIAKEPIAKKGARITSHIALPGRFLVFMPTVTHVGVSRKIASDEERQRLKRILVHERGEASGGFIVRTAAEGASEDELRADLRFLLHLWDEIKNRSEGSKSPALIYHDLSLIERILRDQVSSDFANIWVDSEADYERIVRFLNRFSPNLVRRVKLYTKEAPLFEHFGIQDEISKALRSKVWLKSGGSIVINQTEALVAIDINTGKYVGKSARLEDTILKTNLDAVPEIVRQIRLRDLGGIIVIDFIDMDERKNRFKVMAALEEALKTDRAPTKVLQFNDFGLVAITRKRVKQSLERTLSVPCPTCQATGMVKSPATVCNEIWTEMRKMRKHFESADVMLRVHPETVKVLKAGNGRWLTELEELVGKNILIKTDPALHPEQFDIQG